MLTLKIKNYKSIVEIEYKINNNINYIIGKNESGKSNVIGAINELNNSKITKKFKNFNSEGESNIEFTYFVSANLDKEWKTLVGISSVYVNWIIDEEGKKYSDNQMFLDQLKEKLFPLYKVEDLDNNKLIGAIKNNELILRDGQTDDDTLLLKINDLVNKSLDFHSMYDVIYYSQADFPYLKRKYYFHEAKQDKTFLALWKLLKQDISDIDNLINLKDDEQLDLKNKLQDELSTKLGSFIKDFWKQKTISFKIDILDSEFVVRAADLFDQKNGKFRDLDLRSSGMISYLTLVLFISSLDLSKENILLLDEPASKLHTSAVLDLKRFFEKSNSKLKFVIATHNTSFIDWNNIDKFSLALKNDVKKGTEIIHKFVQKSIGEKKSGLSPFLYQLGIDKKALFSISDNINVFVEGILDVILLRSMHQIYKEKEKSSIDINFIPLGSATKQNSLISFSFATNEKLPYFIFDKDKEGKKGAKKIVDSFYNGEKQNNIFFIDGEDIDDKNINDKNIDDKKIETQNLFLKEKFDKQIIAKNKSFVFYYKLTKAIIEKEHKPNDKVYENFKKVFDRIN